MFIKRLIHRFRFMEQAGDPAPGGGTPAPAPAPGEPAAPVAPATPPASLLQTGGDPAPGGNEYIPEKFRTNNAEGAFDLEASARAMAESYSGLEKRFGSGDVPPKTAAEYKVEVPEALKEAIDPATDPGVQGFLSGALEAGLNQKQVDFVMGKYFEMAPKLAAGAAQFDATTATAELKKSWATEADFKRNVQNAHVATNAAAQKAGIDMGEILSGPLGNNPTFLKLMAALGPEFSEDTPPGGSKMTTDGDINALLSSEAYMNPRHIDHAKTSEQVRRYFERKHGTEAAA